MEDGDHDGKSWDHKHQKKITLDQVLNEKDDLKRIASTRRM